ncbi:MAG: dihydrolipoamide succinyltransferase [Gammaproteobacteria bacterium]|nr:dihydrolipoamide succinyltransferase [Gammaproteobacteria bacterium]
MPQTIDIMLSADELEGTEATVSQWLFKIGEQIQQGEPLLELETDKVSMEICAPETGILSDIRVNVGDKVETDSILGQLSDDGLVSISEPIALPEDIDTQTELPSEHTDKIEEPHKDGKLLISPTVRRLLKENNLDINHINGTGKNGRVNRDDVMQHLAKSPKAASNPIKSSGGRTSRTLTGTMVPHTNMRKSIAKHMVESLLEISPHVTSVFEMDMSNIIEHRKWHKKEFAEQGVNLTFTAYFLAATVKSMQKAPEVNARFHEDALEIFSDINIGVGTALGTNGLVVPVVQQVQSMTLFEIAQALTLQTKKARDGNLKPSDMTNGTFTISNHGVSGSLFAAPIIINQPEVAILGIGKLEKRVVVEEINQQDTIVIKPMCYVSLSIDHRALDAYQTSEFLSEFVETINNWGE